MCHQRQINGGKPAAPDHINGAGVLAALSVVGRADHQILDAVTVQVGATGDGHGVQIVDSLADDPVAAGPDRGEVDFGGICLAEHDIGAVGIGCANQDVIHAITVHVADSADRRTHLVVERTDNTETTRAIGDIAQIDFIAIGLAEHDIGRAQIVAGVASPI